jgi:hypothetical protein
MLYVNSQYQSVLASSGLLLNHYLTDNLKSAAPGGSPELFNNFNSWYGLGTKGNGQTYTCNIYASPECLTLIATFSNDQPTVPSNIASQAASMRCGNWASDPALNTDYMLVIGKFRHCNNNWLGGSCFTVYPYLSRCCKFLFDHTNFYMFCQ